LEFIDRCHEVETGGGACFFLPMRLSWSGEKGEAQDERLRLEIDEPSGTTLQVMVTARCNLSCAYCSHRNNPPIAIAPDWRADQMEKVLRRVRALPPNGLLIITGGEPLLAPDLVYSLAAACPAATVVFTNGTLLDERAIGRMAEARCIPIVSRDGRNSVNSRRRRRDHSGERDAPARVEAALGLLAGSGMEFGVSMVLGEHNVDIIEQEVAYLDERYSPSSFGVNIPHFTRDVPMERIDPERYTQAFIRLFQIAKKRNIYIDQIARHMMPFATGSPRLRDCSAADGKRVLFPGGVVRDCINQSEGSAPLDGWKDRLPVLTRSCETCIAIGHCGGGCLFDGEKLGVDGFDPRYCDISRGLTLAFLDDFMRTPGLERTNRQELRRRYASLLYRGSGSARFSIGHSGPIPSGG